jgi:hypothetical protein
MIFISSLMVKNDAREEGRADVLELYTVYGGLEPSMNRVVVPAHQAT